MKINELLYEATDNPFDAIKAMNKEFKDLALKFEMSLVAGMGWPNINQKGGWFGGGLGSKGGNNKKQDTLSLPIENRRKGFLKELAKKLEGYMDEGREIEIGQGASRARHSEKGINGHIFDQLVKNAVIDKPPGNVDREKMPCVVWFVGFAGDLAGKSPLRITANFYGPPPEGSKYGGSHLYVDVGGTIDLAAGKKMHMALNKFKKLHGPWSEYKDNKSVEHHADGLWIAFMKDVARFMSKVSGKALPDDYTGEDAGYFNIDRKVLPSSTPRLTPEQMEQLLAIFWKHIK
jgi:hypothetical protein